MKEADSVERCRLARASFRLTAGFGTLIVGQSKYLFGYDSLKFSNIVSLHNFVRGKYSMTSGYLYSGWSAAAPPILTLPGVKQTLAFIGLYLNSSPLPPGFVTKLIHVRERREHVGKRNRLPSSAGLLAKEYYPDDGYEGETPPPLHLGQRSRAGCTSRRELAGETNDLVSNPGR